MSCLVCGEIATIKSHLIPKTMAREVQVGKSHAFARGPNDFDRTQSGIHERNILCAICDNKLSKAENIAARAFRVIRTNASKSPEHEDILNGVAGNDILRFVAGVLWKYSVASQQNGMIKLGPYQNVLRDVAFSNKQIPQSIDALLIRLKCHQHDDDVFAYQAPELDRQEGVNGYRLLLGGVFIFAKIDKQNPKRGALEMCSIRGKPNVPYVVMRAQDFVEYRLSAKLAHSGLLSTYLDKQDGR